MISRVRSQAVSRAASQIYQHTDEVLKCEHLVVGGGAVGSSVALHLAQSGAQNVVVLEKDCCFRQTSAMLSAGGIRQQFSLPENVKLSIYGSQFLKTPQALAVDGDVPDFQLHEIGYLFLAPKRASHILLDNLKVQHECGAHWIKLMDQQALAQKFPWLNTSDLDIGTFGETNEGYFDPWTLIGSMKKKAISLGVTWIDGKAVGGKLRPLSSGSRSFAVDSVHFQLTSSKLSEQERKIVREISAANVINCAGAWSGGFVDALIDQSLSAAHDRNSVHRLPVVPRKRCIFNIHCPGLQSASHSVPPMMTPLTVDPSGVYFRPERQAGRYICGVSPTEEQDRDYLTAEEQEKALETVDDALFYETIWPVLFERVPAFEELKVTNSWAGFYDYNTVDQNLIIGEHSEIRNMTLANGLSGHGLQMGPGVGRAVTELLLHKKYTSIDLNRFSFERIVDKKPLFETGIV